MRQSLNGGFMRTALAATLFLASCATLRIEGVGTVRISDLCAGNPNICGIQGPNKPKIAADNKSARPQGPAERYLGAWAQGGQANAIRTCRPDSPPPVLCFDPDPGKEGSCDAVSYAQTDTKVSVSKKERVEIEAEIAASLDKLDVGEAALSAAARAEIAASYARELTTSLEAHLRVYTLRDDAYLEALCSCASAIATTENITSEEGFDVARREMVYSVAHFRTDGAKDVSSQTAVGVIADVSANITPEVEGAITATLKAEAQRILSRSGRNQFIYGWGNGPKYAFNDCPSSADDSAR